MDVMTVVESRLQGMALLKDDWDGENGVTPLAENIQAARELIELARPAEPFAVGPLAWGGVQVDYSNQDTDSAIEIECSLDSFAYLYMPGNSRKRWQTNELATRDEVLALVREVCEGQDA